MAESVSDKWDINGRLERADEAYRNIFALYRGMARRYHDEKMAAQEAALDYLRSNGNKTKDQRLFLMGVYGIFPDTDLWKPGDKEIVATYRKAEKFAYEAAGKIMAVVTADSQISKLMYVERRREGESDTSLSYRVPSDRFRPTATSFLTVKGMTDVSYGVPVHLDDSITLRACDEQDGHMSLVKDKLRREYDPSAIIDFTEHYTVGYDEIFDKRPRATLFDERNDDRRIERQYIAVLDEARKIFPQDIH